MLNLEWLSSSFYNTMPYVGPDMALQCVVLETGVVHAGEVQTGHRVSLILGPGHLLMRDLTVILPSDSSLHVEILPDVLSHL